MKMGSGILTSNNYLMLAAGISVGAGKPYKKMAKRNEQKLVYPIRTNVKDVNGAADEEYVKLRSKIPQAS